MPKDCIFLLSFDLFLGGGGFGLRVLMLVQIGSGSYLFVQLKMRGSIKFCNHFWRVMYFFAFQFPSYKKETIKDESITRQILFFYNQTDGIPNQHNMVLAVLSPLKNKLVLLSITQCGHHELCRGVWSYVFQKLFKNWVSKMAIPNILILISYSSNTNFLLVNFTIVEKQNYKKGASIGPQPPSPLDPPLQIHEHLQQFTPLRIWVVFHSWTFFFQPYFFAPRDACFCYFEFGRWKHQIISSGKEI